MKESTSRQESKLKNKSSLVSNVRKTSLSVKEPLVCQSITDFSQDSCCNEIVTEANHLSTKNHYIRILFLQSLILDVITI